MSDDLHTLSGRFFETFVQPLFLGGELHAQRLLKPGYAEYFVLNDWDPELETALGEDMRAIATMRALPHEDLDLVRFWMALSNLLTLSDPALDRLFSRGAARKAAAWTQQLIEAIGLPATRESLVARHVTLLHLERVQRHDTTVKTWAYTHRFFGRPPAKNVVAMPKLRFVHQTPWTTYFEKILSGRSARFAPVVDLESLYDDLLLRSPLTTWSHHERFEDLEFGHALMCALSDPSVRSAWARTLHTLDPLPIAKLGRAYRVLSARDPSPQHLFIASLALLELQLLNVLDRGEGYLATSEPGVGDGELFIALLPAALDNARAQGPFAPWMELGAFTAQKVERVAEDLRQRAGADAVEYAASVLARSAAC